MRNCKWCNESIEDCKIANHTRWCKENPRHQNGSEAATQIVIKQRINESNKENGRGSTVTMFIPCKHCGDVFEHIKRVNKKEYIPAFCTISCANRHRTIIDGRKCTNCGEKFNINRMSKRKCCSEKCANELRARCYASREHTHSTETKLRLSEAAKKRKLGGYQKGSGRGKSGWYKEIYCDSSWELAYVIYNKDRNISIERNKQKFEYVWGGKKLKYIPDFVVAGELIEIKGWNSAQAQAKIKSCTKPLKVLYEKDLKEVFDYVKHKYGKDFIRLYEK